MCSHRVMRNSSLHTLMCTTKLRKNTFTCSVIFWRFMTFMDGRRNKSRCVYLFVHLPWILFFSWLFTTVLLRSCFIALAFIKRREKWLSSLFYFLIVWLLRALVHLIRHFIVRRVLSYPKERRTEVEMEVKRTSRAYELVLSLLRVRHDWI